MAQQRENSDPLVPHDATFDAVDQPGLSLPYSQDEIQDLLFGSDRSVEERVERLKEMRSEMTTRESGDFGDEDPKDMIAEIDRALAELQGDVAIADDNIEAGAAVDMDPSDHLDALSPDDIDARAALTGEDAFYDDDEDGPVDDDNAWAGSEEFRHDIH
jgi:hypothetical protein